jgi:hypothetical protein
MKKTFFVNTPYEHFARWLEDRTRSFATLSFNLDNGRFTMLRASFNQITRVVVMKGTHIWFDKEGAERGGESYCYRDAITFSLIPLSSSRTEVHAQCHQNDACPMFDNLLQDIQQRWPETTSDTQPLEPPVANIDISAGLLDVASKQQAILDAIAHNKKSAAKFSASLSSADIGLNDEVLALLGDVHSTVQLLLDSSLDIEESIKSLLVRSEDLISGEASISNKVELVVPIIPLLLNYKAEISVLSKLDLSEALARLDRRWKRLLTLINGVN